MATSSRTPAAMVEAAEGRRIGASPGGAVRPTKLFLGGLTRNTTTKQLRDHFVKYGHVLDCVAMRHPDGRPRGFGYVTLDSTAAAERCLTEPQVIDGRVIDMKRAVPGSTSPTAAMDAAAATPRVTARTPHGASHALGPPFFPSSAWDVAAAAACMGYPGSPQTPSVAAWASWAALAARSPAGSSPDAILTAMQGLGLDDATPTVTPAARNQRQIGVAAAQAPTPPSASSPQKVALPRAVRSHRSVLADITNKAIALRFDCEALPVHPMCTAAGKENCLPTGAVVSRSVCALGLAGVTSNVPVAPPPGLSPLRPGSAASPWLTTGGALASPMKLESLFAATPAPILIWEA